MCDTHVRRKAHYKDVSKYLEGSLELMEFMQKNGRPMFAYAFDSSLIFELKDLGVAAHNFTDLLYSGRFGPTQKNILSKLGKAPKISDE